MSKVWRFHFNSLTRRNEPFFYTHHSLIIKKKFTFYLEAKLINDIHESYESCKKKFCPSKEDPQVELNSWSNCISGTTLLIYSWD